MSHSNFREIKTVHDLLNHVDTLKLERASLMDDAERLDEGSAGMTLIDRRGREIDAELESLLKQHIQFVTATPPSTGNAMDY